MNNEEDKNSLGFLLVSTYPSKVREVYAKLESSKTEVEGAECVDIHPLWGDWDLILKVKALDYNVLGEYHNFVKEIPGVANTKMFQTIKARKS